MDWIQFLILFLTMIGMFLNSRAEAKSSEKEWKENKEKVIRHFQILNYLER